MTDDQGWGDTGYNGHPYLKTPNLDRMAAEGVTFTRFYSAAAMCSPTRGSCYTGRHPYRYGITYAMEGMLEPTEIPITTLLKQSGYTTGHFGKWHIGTLTPTKGDQKRWGQYAMFPERYYCPPWERDVDACFVTESKVPTWNPMIAPGKDKPYGNNYFTGPGQIVEENLEGDDSRVIMDRVLPFIRQAVQQKKPFFSAIWFHAPHSPIVGGDKYLSMYADRPEHERPYYACLTAMDEQVGRLRAELKRLGVAQNTMLWFCSDNGPARQRSVHHVGSSGLLSGFKFSIKEGGIRVPGLLVWPNKVKQPVIVDTPCGTFDYFPTILDALDIPLPDDRVFDGMSMLPFITGEKTKRDKPIGFLNRGGKEAAWIADRYKLLVTQDGAQLFDIREDPSEKNDLAKTYPEIHCQMQSKLNEWKTDVLTQLKRISKPSE